MKKLNLILNLLGGVLIGLFAAEFVYFYKSFAAVPDISAAYSVPSYVGIVVQGIITVIFLLILFILKSIIKKRIKNESN